MSLFYVFQGETYDLERRGGYVWSPKLTKSGHHNAGYTMMTKVRKGDFIFHNSNGKVMSISIAKNDCYDGMQPRELANAEKSIDWDDDGYRIDTEYYDFDVPLITADYQEWLRNHYIENSAFTTVGRGKQQYMCSLADEHAIFLLEQAIISQKDPYVLNHLRDALTAIIGDKSSEYGTLEVGTNNETFENFGSHPKPVWIGLREEQSMTMSPNTGIEILKQDPKQAAGELKHADYTCVTPEEVKLSVNEMKLVTKQAFRDYLLSKGYKNGQIADYEITLKLIENEYDMVFLEKDTETFLTNIIKISKIFHHVENRKELFAELEQIIKMEQKKNMMLAYARKLDEFLHNNYQVNPNRITAITINSITNAWLASQTQKNIVQTDPENPLLFTRIALEFPKVSLLGDIEISDEEYKLLIFYFRHLFDVERISKSYKMGADPFFAVVLVQIGIRHYNDNFWPDVGKELNVDIKRDVNKQKIIRQNFRSVLDCFGKVYLEKDENIQNIMLHGFVSNHFAAGFFDNLYRYYRIDLHRNLENNTDNMLEKMVSRISENKNNRFVVQTKYAAMNAPERTAEIIKKLLELMDIGFHDDEFKNPSTRLHRLLNQWMQAEEFQNDLKREIRSRSAYVKRFSKPYLHYDKMMDSVTLIIPSQMVDDEGQVKLKWSIKTNHEEYFRSVAILDEGVTGAKTDSVEIPLPVSQWFDEISMKVIDPVTGKDFSELFIIPEEPVRFFDNSGMSRNPKHMPTGELTAVVKKGCSVQSDCLVDGHHFQTHNIMYLNLEAGDIVHISNGNNFIAGQIFIEGIPNSVFARDVVSVENGKIKRICTILPTIRFKTKPEMVMGMVIYANGRRYSIRNNPPLPIDLGIGEDEKGYEISLKQYIPDKAGSYYITLDFPDLRCNRGPFAFVYLPHFSFDFHYKPYIFQEEGSVSFSCVNFDFSPLQKDIQLNVSRDAYTFPIDKKHLNLSFSVKIDDVEIPISIKVPSLRYSIVEGEWHTDVPEYMMMEDLGNEILFDFPDEKLDVSLISEEGELEALSKDSVGIFHYSTNTIRNYSVGNQVEIDIYLDSPEIQKRFQSKQRFTTILMRSIVRNKQITVDFEKGLLNGFVEIWGKGTYSVDVTYNHVKIANDIPLKNGNFSLEGDFVNGIYQFDVYENEEDRFGLGFERKLLDSFNQKLIDVHDLSGKSVKIKKLFYKKNEEKKSYRVQDKLIIRNLERAEKDGRHCYTGYLNRLKDRTNIKIRVYFPDSNDLSSAYITYWDDSENEYCDFIYETIKSELLFIEASGYRIGNHKTDLYKYKRYILLNCNEKEDWDSICNGVEEKSKFEVSIE